MALTARAPGPYRSRPNAVMVVVLSLMVVSRLAQGFPLDGRELDSAVEGVQKYLESSGFPKMTRGEVLDFLNDFSRNARVSRSGNTAAVGSSASRGSDKNDQATFETFSEDKISATPGHGPSKIPNGVESPLNYGYPMSMQTVSTVQIASSTERIASTTPMIFVTAVPESNSMSVGDKKKPEAAAAASQTLSMNVKTAVNGRNVAPKKSIVPPADLNAYSKFKKIPEGKNLKLDDEMKDFLNGFGLLDESGPKATVNNSAATIATARQSSPPTMLQRRIDDAVTGTVDQKLLESLLAATGNDGVNHRNTSRSLQPFLDSVSNRADHVFNPTDVHVKTVDVNRIAKIVENIRLLTDDNNTILLPQDVIQKKLENITAAIATIDQPTDDNKVFHDGYEVFFDDSSKEIDSDLPDTPTGSDALEPLTSAQNPPDPLSTEELQQLLEKNKNDVKRQEPANDTSTVSDDVTTSTTTEQQSASEDVSSASEVSSAPEVSSESEVSSTPDASSASVQTTSAASTTDSSSEATSAIEVTSDASAARDFSTTAAAADVKPSLSQLAESFGGGETASAPPPPLPVSVEQTDAPPNRPRNGLYFYVDWNSFLTVNQGQKNQVNLRFAPKAGNPDHFLRVTVP